jgi:hypothetical protein
LFNRRTGLFFYVVERLHSCILTACVGFVRGLLAVSWQECGVP